MTSLRGLIFVLLALFLALPATALAGGPPLPPAGIFQVPPTPTPPPPLPTWTPPAPAVATATATATPTREISTAQETRTQVLFFPRLTSRDDSFNVAIATPAIATPAPAAAPAAATLIPPTLAPPSPFPTATPVHSDPLTASFTYEVKPGDTLGSLAIAFGRDDKAMFCVRRADGSPLSGDLKPGESIIVPPLSDLCHLIKAGDSLAKIAAWYGVSIESMTAAAQNQGQPDGSLLPGQYLLIPNARSRYRDPAEVHAPRQPANNWRYGDGNFIWPIDRSQVWVSQGFRHGRHMAIDMATKPGTAVMAADTGAVIEAGWSDNGYGYHIVIDHGIDYITLYAHLSEYYVKKGDIVKKGDVIGVVGSTGNSTGPHLHFEVRDYGYLVDPLLVLPKQ